MGFISQVKSNRMRAWKSVTLAIAFMALGFNCSIFGPTILDLQLLVNTTIDKITLTIPARSLGSVLGSVLCKPNLFTDRTIMLMIIITMMMMVMMTQKRCFFRLSEERQTNFEC